MTDDKEPMQADGEGMPPEDPADSPSAGRPDMRDNAGQSGGGAYPNPHEGEDEGEFEGGQGVRDYFGSERGAEENAATEGE